MAPTDVKQGDRVIYRAAGTEYDAVALSAPSFGHHTGLRSVGHFLNLRYLDERGAAVTIMGAGLLTSAADDATIAEYARANVEASGAAKFAADGGESLLAEERERLRAQPRTTGWRPRVDGEEVADLKATIKEYERSFNELTSALNVANEMIAKLQARLVAGEPQPENARNLFEIWSKQIATVSAATAATGGAETLQDLNSLLEMPSMPQIQPDGSMTQRLPVEPSIVWNFAVVIPTIQEFMIENADLRVKNPAGWGRMEQYYGMCQDMQTAQLVRKAQLELKVNQAGQQAGRVVTDPATDLIPAEGAPVGDFTDAGVSGRPQPENAGAPSSADLDAAAAEAAATEATGGPGPDDEPA